MSGTHFLHLRLHLEDFVDARRFEELGGHAPHDKGRRLPPLEPSDQCAVIVAKQAQEIGAAALAPAQIACVIDEPREVRILEIDADGKQVTATCAVLDEAAGEIGPAAFSHVQARTSTNTISGGIPSLTGTVEQPSPPETI